MGPNRNWNPGDWNIVSHWGGHSNPSSAKFLGFMIVSPQPMMPNSRSRVYACGREAQCSSSRPSTPLRRRSRFGFQGTSVVPWHRDKAAGPPSRPRPTVMSAVPLGAAIIKRIRRSCGSSATNLRCGRMRHSAPPRGGNCRKHERVRKLAAVDSLSDESVE